MIQENRNVIGNEIIFVITKKGDEKVRMMMIQENRNVIGNEINLVITKKETTK